MRTLMDVILWVLGFLMTQARVDLMGAGNIFQKSELIRESRVEFQRGWPHGKDRKPLQSPSTCDQKSEAFLRFWHPPDIARVCTASRICDCSMRPLRQTPLLRRSLHTERGIQDTKRGGYKAHPVPEGSGLPLAFSRTGLFPCDLDWGGRSCRVEQLNGPALSCH